MYLCDTGILVAAINPADPNNKKALAALTGVRVAPVATWPCLTEAMYLVGARGQEKLRRQIEGGLFKLYTPTQADMLRAFALMRKYADAPMDFADASLVVAAEVLRITRILTLDSHFYVYRIHDKTHFEVIP
jgi:predicted nucleic acid-binding protein